MRAAAARRSQATLRDQVDPEAHTWRGSWVYLIHDVAFVMCILRSCLIMGLPYSLFSIYKIAGDARLDTCHIYIYIYMTCV